MMKIEKLDDIEFGPNNLHMLGEDLNGRVINMYRLFNTVITGESIYYPNTLLLSLGQTNHLYNPINEQTMSLKDVQNQTHFNVKVSNTNIKYKNFFYFIYNTDNYFHFIYDTLPYLISYFKLKEITPDVKLLMAYPNKDKKEIYQFVKETLEILGIDKDDIEFVNPNTHYKTIYVSSSYTHGIDSNLPPRNEIYSLYQEMVNKFTYSTYNVSTPKKIYVSRRSWIHGDFSNIGTNYTTRRKMINEDALVELLTKHGYVEVFPETMTMEEKIVLFSNAESVVGAFGGGICNVLFSKPECELIAIASPHFLDVNKRFKFSLNQVNLKIFDDVKNVENGEFKTYMRVKFGDIVGEINSIDGNMLTISYSETPISGWNNEVVYKTMVVDSKDCVKLDNGLNSPWEIDLDKFKEKYL